MFFLRHLLFYAITLGWTLLLSPTILLALVSQTLAFWISRLWTKGILLFANVFLGIKHTLRGLEYLPKQGAYFIACKHQSAWETLFFSTLLQNPAFFLKRELLWVPVVGWFLRRLEMIPVARKGRADKERARMHAFLRKAIALHRPIILFPEGTRTAPGARPVYHTGIYVLSTHYALPVIPAGLNSGVFWKRRGLWKTPGTIVVTFCPPMPTDMSRKDFMALLIDTIEKASVPYPPLL